MKLPNLPFNVEDKIFKILADQSSANKKAFKNVIECDIITEKTVLLILNQRAKDRKEKRKQEEEAKQANVVREYMKEIDDMNKNSQETPKSTTKKIENKSYLN